MTEEYLFWLKGLITENKLSLFYSSERWRRLSEKVLREQKECQVCKQNHTYGKAEIAHHVNTVRECPELALSIFAPDGSLNIIAVCQSCHNKIHFGSKRYTNEERW